MHTNTRNLRAACTARLLLSLAVTGCGGSSMAEGASSAEKAPDAQGAPAIQKLEALKAQLSASLAELIKPLEEAHAVLDALEALLERARLMSDAAPVTVPPAISGTPQVDGQEPTVGAGLQKPVEPRSPPEVAKPNYTPAVARIVVSIVNTGEAQGLADAQVPGELQAEARKIGAQLRDLLASIGATDKRVVAVGETLASAVVGIPTLAAEATASAQLELNNPFADASAKADAQQTLQRVEALTQELENEVSGVQQKLGGLPVRAQELAMRAQTLLEGAPLSPPSIEVPAAQLVVVSGPAAAPTSTAGRCTENPTVDGGDTSTTPWGWYVAAGTSAIVTGVGIGVNVGANRQLARCEDSSGFGCSNYDQIRQEQDIGVMMWSAGAALTASFITFILVTNNQSERPQQQATFWCSTGYSGASCHGTY